MTDHKLINILCRTCNQTFNADGCRHCYVVGGHTDYKGEVHPSGYEFVDGIQRDRYECHDCYWKGYKSNGYVGDYT